MTTDAEKMVKRIKAIQVSRLADKEQPVALVDLDGTCCAYDQTLFKDLNALRCEHEPFITAFESDTEPAYLKARMNLIRNSSDWWENLPELPLGMQMFHIMKEIGFRMVVCTAGPKKNADAWKGKVLWCLKHLPEGTDIIITRDKGLIYGNVLMDDWPEYTDRWLAHRPRGLVIMPAHDHNKGYTHPNAIRWTGTKEEYVKIRDRLLGIYNVKMMAGQEE